MNDCKVCIEVMMDKDTHSSLSVSAKTEVLGGRIARMDWTGDTFDRLDLYEELITATQLYTLSCNEDYKARIQQAINKVFSEIYEEEEWEEEDETL